MRTPPDSSPGPLLPPPAPALPRLGIAGLPERWRLLATGDLHAVAADRRVLRRQLLAATLRDALAAGRPVLRIAEPDPWLRGSASLDAFRRAGLLIEADAAALGPLTGDARPAIAAVARRLPAGGLLVFDRADPFFCLHAVNAADAAAGRWHDWATAGGHPVLALFEAVAGPARELATLRAIAGRFAGFAIVRTSGGRVTLHLRHWGVRGGEAARSSWLLGIDPGGGGLMVQAEAQDSGGGAGPAGPGVRHARVIVTQAAVADFGSLPPDWQVVDGWSGALQAARRAPAGVLLLHFRRGQDFRPLARAVAAACRAVPEGGDGGQRHCRHSPVRPPTVVIRETGATLRIAQQLVLLRLGAALIVASGTDRLRVQAAVHTLADGGAAPVAGPSDPERALAEAGLAEAGLAAVGQPCPPATFAADAERLLDGTDCGLQHALLRLDPVGDDLPRLASIAARRARDARCCVHDGALWLFLLGCPPQRIDPVLARLFGARHARLFVRRTAHVEPAGIRDALAAFAQPPRPTSSPAAPTSSAGR